MFLQNSKNAAWIFIGTWWYYRKESCLTYWLLTSQIRRGWTCYSWLNGDFVCVWCKNIWSRNNISLSHYSNMIQYSVRFLTQTSITNLYHHLIFRLPGLCLLSSDAEPILIVSKSLKQSPSELLPTLSSSGANKEMWSFSPDLLVVLVTWLASGLGRHLVEREWNMGRT